MDQLDLQIDAQHLALEKAESDACNVAARLEKIPGAESLARRKRGYGQLGAMNPWAPGHENLSAQAAIAAADRPFAAWLAHQAGRSLPAPDYRAQAEGQRRADELQRLQARTEELRAANQARRQRQERQRTHGWFTPEGTWVV